MHCIMYCSIQCNLQYTLHFTMHSTIHSTMHCTLHCTIQCIISASLITTDGAYHCPVGSIWPFFSSRSSSNGGICLGRALFGGFGGTEWQGGGGKGSQKQQDDHGNYSLVILLLVAISFIFSLEMVEEKVFTKGQNKITRCQMISVRDFSSPQLCKLGMSRSWNKLFGEQIQILPKWGMHKQRTIGEIMFLCHWRICHWRTCYTRLN